MRDPEDQLRGIVLAALGRVGDDRGFTHAITAANSVLAVLADEIPDGFDDLLRCLADRGHRVRCVGVGRATSPVVPRPVGWCPVCSERVVVDRAGVALEHSRWPGPE